MCVCVWQSEDDLAEKLRSNDMLQRAINSYREAAELPDVTSDLLRAALKRRAERQQFLGDPEPPPVSSSCLHLLSPPISTCLHL